MIPDGGGGSRGCLRQQTLFLDAGREFGHFPIDFECFSWINPLHLPSPSHPRANTLQQGKIHWEPREPAKTPNHDICNWRRPESSESSPVGFARLLLDSFDCGMCLRHFSKRAGEILALRVVLRKHSRPIPLPPNHAPVKFLTSSKQYSVHNGWKFSKK